MTDELRVESLAKRFGGLQVFQQISFNLPSGEILGVIGPNGAGKTTCFNLLTGVYRPDAGHIRLADRELTGLKPFQITAAGMARTFQNIRLFQHLTVLDNVKVACHLRSRQTIAGVSEPLAARR